MIPKFFKMVHLDDEYLMGAQSGSAAGPLRLSALRNYSRALADLNPVPWDRVSVLVNFCPTVFKENSSPAPRRARLKSTGDILFEDTRDNIGIKLDVSKSSKSLKQSKKEISVGNSKQSTFESTETSSAANAFYCEAILDLSEFIIKSNGQWLNRLLPKFLSYLSGLEMFCEMPNSESEPFVESFILSLLRLSLTFESSRQEILSGLVEFINSIVTLNNDSEKKGVKSVVKGVQNALTKIDKWDFLDGNSCKKLISFLLYYNNNLSISVISKLLDTSAAGSFKFKNEEVFTDDIINKFFDLAVNIAENHDTISGIQLAANVVLGCSIINSKISRNAYDWLRDKVFSGVLISKSEMKDDMQVFYCNILSDMYTVVSSNSELKSEYVEYLESIIIDKNSNIAAYELIMGRLINLYSKGVFEKAETDTDLIKLKGIVHKLSNLLIQSEVEESEDSISFNSRMITCLASIALEANINSLTEEILPILVGRFCQTDSIVNLVLLKQLTRIAMLEQRDHFDIIIDLLCKIYLNPYAANNTSVSSEIPNVFEILSNEMSSSSLKIVFLDKILNTFNQLGFYVQEMVSKSAHAQTSSLAGRLGYLLPTIANLMPALSSQNSLISKDQSISNEKEEATIWDDYLFFKKVRSMWFYCTLYGFVLEKLWSLWFSSVIKIARRMPVLVFAGKPYSALELELEVTALAPNVSNADIITLRKSLSMLLATSSEIEILIQRQPFYNVIWLLSIYYLESLRLSSPVTRIVDIPQNDICTCKSTFCYPLSKQLENKRFCSCIYCSLFTYIFDRGVRNAEYNANKQKLSLDIRAKEGGDVLYLMTLVASRVYKTSINIIFESDEFRDGKVEKLAENLIENLFISILRNFCSHLEIVRKLCDMIILKFITTFSQVVFSPIITRFLLEFLNILSNRIDLSKTGLIKDFTSGNTYLKDKNTFAEFALEHLDLPTFTKDLALSFNRISNLIISWVSEGMIVAPSQMIHILQNFSIENSDKGAGLSLAQRVLGYNKTILETLRFKNLSVNSSFDKSYELESKNLEYSVPKEYFSGVQSKTHTISVLSELFDTLSSLSSSKLINRKNVGIDIDSTEDQSDQNEISLENNTKYIAVYEKIKNDFEELIDKYKEDKSVNNGSDMKKFKNLMLRSSYFLIHSFRNINILNEFQREELWKFQCWLPVLIWSQESLKISVFCWNWILNSKVGDETSLMNELFTMWEWTIAEGLGLFGGVHSENLVEPHQIWLEFLMERFELVKHRSSNQVLQFSNMIQISIIDPQILSSNVDSLGCRVSLFKIALSVLMHTFPLRNLLSIKDMSVVTHRIKVYESILSWFEYSSGYYEESKRSILDSVMDKLVDCWLLMKYEYSNLRAQQKSVRLEGNSRHIRSASVMSASSRNNSTIAEEDSFLSDYPNQVPAFNQPYTIANQASIGAMHAINLTMKQQSFFNTEKHGRYSGIFGQRRASTFGHSQTLDTQSKEKILTRLVGLSNLVLILLENEFYRESVWHNPVGVSGLKFKSESRMNKPPIQNSITMSNAVSQGFQFSPLLVYRLPERIKDINIGPAVIREIERLTTTNALDLVKYKQAIPYLVTKKNVDANDAVLGYLLYWTPITDVLSILALLSPNLCKNVAVMGYAVKCLRYLPDPNVLLTFIPQIVQSLRYDINGFLEDFLTFASSKSLVFLTQLIWNLTTEENSETWTPDDPLAEICKNLKPKILNLLVGNYKILYDNEVEFFNQITKISGILKPLSHSDRKKKIAEELAKAVPKGMVYLPTDPLRKVVEVIYDSGIPLKSHAKVPIMVSFNVIPLDPKVHLLDEKTEYSDEEEDIEPIKQAVIFKVDDDMRQDVLALQVIRLFKDIFDEIGLDLYLYPYNVIATSPGCGVMEVVPNSDSRDGLGKSSGLNLHEYFLQQFDGPDSIKYRKTQENFIKSMAAYSVVSYILQIKDRHNGNMLIDGDGHIVHIDFGFIFDISPGGNLKFERSPFKLGYEMIEIMGGSIESPLFQLFSKLCVRAYLAIRPKMDKCLTLVELMLDAKFPCFRPATIQNLKSRFNPDLTEREAADFMLNKITESYGNYYTVVYDGFQAWQNDIDY